MTDLTRILVAIEQSEPEAAERLLPLVYDELRKLAAQKLAREKPGQTLQATALVHEAYLRLVDQDQGEHWDGRGHFFAAAAQAMRRILVEAKSGGMLCPRAENGGDNSFPRSAWECRLRRSASSGSGKGPQSGQGGIPTQSVGTSHPISLLHFQFF